MSTTLSVAVRSILGKRTKQLRRQGTVPGVLYGHGVAPVPISVDAAAFDKVYRQAGASTLVDLVVDSAKPVKVLVQEVQVHPTSGRLNHVDFHQVRMDEELEVDVPLKFVGESPAVKGLGGVLVRVVDELKVKCLPKHLVHELPVDISRLVDFDSSIKLKDIALPPGLTPTSTEPDEVLVTVTPPRSQAELESLKGEVKEDVGAVKVEEKGKKDEEAAGAAASQSAETKPKADKK